MRIRKGAKSRQTTQLRMRVVYLFGAGATHAELANICEDRISDAGFLEKNSLLLASVSKRVCIAAKRDHDFTPKIRSLLSSTGLSNIELFISLLEDNHVPSASDIVQKLKAKLKKDILGRLRHRQERFYLHKALFEFHRMNKEEDLTGVISLNYDGLIDEAYELITGRKPNYCFSQDSSKDDSIPILKLHGGFDLKYREKKLPILAPGVNKNYLELPYSFVWGRALELLLDCDILRIVGCSLSQNDLGIVDLLFKAHIKRNNPPVLQIIEFDPENNRIREHFGFFPKVERALEIEGNLISDVAIRDPFKSSNPFKIWLKAKIERVMKVAEIEKTTYVKKILK